MNCNHPIWSPICSFHYNGECLRDHNYECPALMEPKIKTSNKDEKKTRRLIDADALMQYCSNTKSKTISNNDIARFPTVEERKKGKWIYSDDDGVIYDSYYCSCCHQYITVDAERKCDIGFIIDDFDFCLSCGADMRGEQDAEAN